MSLTITVNPTLTDGTTKVLTLAGVNPGKSTYAFPDHSRTRLHTLETSVSTEGSKAAPVAKTGVKLTSTVVSTEEGCCTVNQATAVFDLGVRYSLGGGNDATKLDADIADFIAYVNTDEFKSAVKAGIVPAV